MAPANWRDTGSDLFTQAAYIVVMSLAIKVHSCHVFIIVHRYLCHQSAACAIISITAARSCGTTGGCDAARLDSCQPSRSGGAMEICDWDPTLIWSFPEMGVPPSHHPFLDGMFPYKPSILSFWGAPIYGNPHNAIGTCRSTYCFSCPIKIWGC